ncbi:MAG: alpha/beta fold hydrolase [Blastocatellia bacterium]|jgi:pimeloyl-ACP methyl ester carboxylesterase
MRLSYRDQGQGPAIVFLHAFPLDQTMWDEQAVALATARRVVTFDWSGFGQSPATAPDSLTTGLDGMVADLLELLDHLGLGQVDLCGLSMGGYAALAFYRSFPERIRSLILCDTKATADPPATQKARQEMAELVIRKGSAALIPLMLPRLLGASTLRRPANPLPDRIAEMIQRSVPQGVARALHAMATRTATTDLLGSIQVPTLLLVGEEDILTTPTEMKEMAGAIPKATLQVIGQAGHLPNLEQPHLFLEALRDGLP